MRSEQGFQRGPTHGVGADQEFLAVDLQMRSVRRIDRSPRRAAGSAPAPGADAACPPREIIDFLYLSTAEWTIA
ncbi:hypothetical protein AB0M87_31015 [Streptomyces sp. NPDC051320]|uniref:hypothetical protein n=1 Tax=Streptomyces sp. NPDC051320 TaxID=3154644 RepID=UPI00342044C5